LFEEFGDGMQVTMFRKVSSRAQKVSSSDEKVSSRAQKVSCADEEVGSEFGKYVPFLKDAGVTDKFIENIGKVFVICGVDTTFGQVNVQEWLACSKSKSTNVMNAMKKANIIKGVSGEGFGKYRFIQL